MHVQLNENSMTIHPHLFCFGYGYSAQVIGQRLLAMGWHVSGTTRSDDKAVQLLSDGIQAVIWDGESALPASVFDNVTHILQSIPPQADGDTALIQCGDVLSTIKTLQSIGYFSTTGVYGDHGTNWVDETTPPDPIPDRSKRRLQAENDWLGWGQTHNKAVHIFRLSGIYGPHRNALTKVKDGKAKRIDVPDQYFSRIHVADIAQTVVASLQKPQAGAIYNVCDDLPETSAVVTTYACQLMGVEPPPLQTLDEADLSPMGRSFYQASRRVRNDKIKRELGVQLQYPTYKEGLQHLYQTNAY